MHRPVRAARPTEPVRSSIQMPADKVIAVLPNPDSSEIRTNRDAFRRTTATSRGLSRQDSYPQELSVVLSTGRGGLQGGGEPFDAGPGRRGQPDAGPGEIGSRVGYQRIQPGDRGVGGDGEGLAHERRAPETAVPAAIGPDAPVKLGG